MPAAFTSWTVLPHKPIENLRRTSGGSAATWARPSGRWSLAKMGDGRLFIHNAIALDDAEMAELEAWGDPA